MKVLLVAPCADLNDVGEAWVAAQWAKRLGERHEVVLLTLRKRGHRSAVGAFPHVRVIEWDEPAGFDRLERFNSLLKPWYPSFYRNVRRWVRAALTAGERFDVAHQPVPVAMRYPSPLTGLGIPYLLGPVGGGLASPRGFAGDDTAPWYVGLRRLDDWRMRHDPVLRRSYEGAARVLVIAPYAADALAQVRLRHLSVMSETGVDHLPEPVRRTSSTKPVRLLFVGRVIRTKGTRDAVAAMAHLRDLPVVLDVVGDGFDRAACESLAGELQVAERVTFHGTVPREQVDDFYRRADVFVFPSFREPGGNAPFEAMSYGLPMVVSDRGGPGYVVTDECGVRVTPIDPRQFAVDLAAAVRRLALDGSLRLRMGAEARERVDRIGTWDQRVAGIERAYGDALARTR